MPELAELFLDKLDKTDGDADAARAAVDKKLTDDRHAARAAKDPYFKRLLSGGELPDDSEDDMGFDALAQTIGDPLRETLVQHETKE